jgi:hypothetical protein
LMCVLESTHCPLLLKKGNWAMLLYRSEAKSSEHDFAQITECILCAYQDLGSSDQVLELPSVSPQFCRMASTQCCQLLSEVAQQYHHKKREVESFYLSEAEHARKYPAHDRLHRKTNCQQLHAA